MEKQVRDIAQVTLAPFIRTHHYYNRMKVLHLNSDPNDTAFLKAPLKGANTEVKIWGLTVLSFRKAIVRWESTRISPLHL